MIIKDEFNLLKNLPNVLNVSSSTLDKYTIDEGQKKVYIMVRLIEKKMSHFSKNSIIKLLSDVQKREKIRVVNFPDYSLPVTYNKPTKEIIINLKPFGADDITPNNPEPRSLYAALVYGLIFANVIEKKVKVSDDMAAPIANYLLTVFVRLFGKDYGLLGHYASQINYLGFLVNCYVLASFFGYKGSGLLKRAGTSAGYDYRKNEADLKKYDFSNIEDFILALSELKIMPGLNKYSFTAKILKMLTLNFLPALEDLGRFLAVIGASSVPGSTLIPGFISKYNESEYQKIVAITNRIVNK